MKRLTKRKWINNIKYIISVFIKMIFGFYIFNYMIITKMKNDYDTTLFRFDDSSLFGLILYFFIFYLIGGVMFNELNRFDNILNLNIF